MTVTNIGVDTEAQPLSMEAFLQSVEVKAYRIALFALGEHADALDVMQDSMIKLITKYEDRPASEWKPLFYRILQNRITDFHRKQKVRSLVHLFKPSSKDDEPEEVPDLAPHPDGIPELALAKEQQQEKVLAMLKALPQKQQQCFLLRSWEGMSVIDTANAMNCSQGTVKTHFFRAVTKLRELLEEEHDVHI